MDLNEIERLLEKYYSGATSEAEEMQLKDFFSKKAIPGHLQADRKLFLFYEQAGQEQMMNRDFEEKIIREISDSGRTPGSRHTSFGKRLISISIGIAAAIALLFGLYLKFDEQEPHQQIALTESFDDPDQAYRETKNALLLISRKLNKGVGKLDKLSKFNKAQELVAKNNESIHVHDINKPGTSTNHN